MPRSTGNVKRKENNEGEGCRLQVVGVVAPLKRGSVLAREPRNVTVSVLGASQSRHNYRLATPATAPVGGPDRRQLSCISIRRDGDVSTFCRRRYFRVTSERGSLSEARSAAPPRRK